MGYNRNYVVGISLIAAMGGLMFGYDWVVIGGAKPFYEGYFSISSSPHLQGWAVSSIFIGCVFGSLLSGYLSDRIGRKFALIGASIFFIISSFGTGGVEIFEYFILFRILGGIGIGLASAISPIYIAEIAPAEYRGRLVSLNQLAIVLGMVFAQSVNYFIAEPMPQEVMDAAMISSWNGQTGWRWMFWAELIPAILFFFFALFVPESPRWFVQNGKDQVAKKVLQKIGGLSYAGLVLNDIKDSIKSDTQLSNNHMWSNSKNKRLVLIGIILAVFQLWCGIDIIFNYGADIFLDNGYGMTEVMFNIIITGLVLLIFTVFAILTIDRIGRRKLLLYGSLGLFIIYVVLSIGYFYNINRDLLFSLIIAAIAVYAMTLGPVVWVVLSEMFPNRIRGKAMAIATTALWLASFTLAYSYPILVAKLGSSGTFLVYGMICLLGYVFVFKWIPETKGKTLEKIEI